MSKAESPSTRPGDLRFKMMPDTHGSSISKRVSGTTGALKKRQESHHAVAEI
jgi:hypothetical protein